MSRDPRAITEYNIIQWFRWADSDPSEIVKGMRANRVERFIFPENLTDEEREKRERAVERARKRASDGDGEQFEGWPEPFAPPSLEPELRLPDIHTPKFVDEKEEEWQGLIPRHSKAYRRASMHDGTQAGVDEMTMRAQGSPFLADEPEPSPPPKRTPAQEEALARRARELARRARR
jgi:hypothetical protein